MPTLKTLALFDPLAARPPASGYPQLDLRNGSVVLDFDDASDESADFPGVLPQAYTGNDFTVVIIWAATTATSGNVHWSAAFERIDPAGDDLDSDDFGTATTVTATTASTSGEVTATPLAITAANAGDPEVGDAFRLRITRDADNAADTMAGDAEVLAIELRED